MDERQRLEIYTSIVPSLKQKIVQRENFNVFFHYGLNTFTGKEWGDGKVSPSVFNPKNQNTDQWVEAVKEAGAYGVIMVCKHHDGFCLWPTKTTSYNISNSPYKDGKGDVVKEVSDSCKKYGLKFGVYLSPWDRNHPAYATDKYNDVFCEQITELFTNYGDIWCIWFDGACGSYMDGKPKQVYDWNRYFSLIKKLSPNTCLSNCAPDIRWVGNEAGVARESEWNVVPKFAYDIQTIEANSQQTDKGDFTKKGADIVSSDLGSREFLSNYSEFCWYPAEVDVSIRPGWFYHKSQDNKLRSYKELLNIYYKSVYGNSLLLLNIPPNKDGLLSQNDVNMLKAIGKHISSAKNDIITIKSITAPEAELGHEIQGVLEYEFDKTTYDPIKYYTPKEEANSYSIKIDLGSEQLINRIQLVENVAFSQRIENFSIYAVVNGERKLIYKGTIVGFNKMCFFKKVKTQYIEIEITKCRLKPYLEYIAVFKDNGYMPKDKLIKKIESFFHSWYYKLLINKENKRNSR